MHIFIISRGAEGPGREILQRPPSVCLSVCCIVFDIDEMLFEFFMNFLNIEKIKFKISFFNISCFLRVSCYFQHFTFHAIFNIKKKIEKCPFTYWLNGRWLLQKVERDRLCGLIKYAYFYYLPRRRRPGTGDIATPPRLSVCLSRLVFAL